MIEDVSDQKLELLLKRIIETEKELQFNTAEKKRKDAVKNLLSNFVKEMFEDEISEN